MGFKSILKKAGEVALVVGGAAVPGAPGVQLGIAALKAFLPAKAQGVADRVDDIALDYIGRIDAIVQSVERIGAASGMTGEQKKAAAISEAMIIATQSFALAGRKIGDEALMQKALDETAQGVALLVQARVDFLNAIKAED